MKAKHIGSSICLAVCLMTGLYNQCYAQDTISVYNYRFVLNRFGNTFFLIDEVTFIYLIDEDTCYNFVDTSCTHSYGPDEWSFKILANCSGRRSAFSYGTYVESEDSTITFTSSPYTKQEILGYECKRDSSIKNGSMVVDVYNEFGVHLYRQTFKQHGEPEREHYEINTILDIAVNDTSLILWGDGLFVEWHLPISKYTDQCNHYTVRIRDAWRYKLEYVHITLRKKGNEYIIVD